VNYSNKKTPPVGEVQQIYWTPEDPGTHSSVHMHRQAGELVKNLR
jgi:hypothetical protein